MSDTVESCIHCGFVLPNDASLEGTSLPIEPPKTEEQSETPEEDVSEDNEDVIACPKCGELSSLKKRFCNTCQENIPLTKEDWRNLGIVALVLAVIIGAYTVKHSGPEYHTTLSKETAKSRCFDMYLGSDLMARGFDVDYQRQMTVKTGENEYSSVIYYRLDGRSRGFNCESIYLQDGKVYVDVYD